MSAVTFELPRGQPRATSRAGGGLLCVAIGLYLLAGAARVFTGTWPLFLTPQLDGIAALLSWLPEPYGTFAAGAVVGLLGLASVAGGLALWTRPVVRTGKVVPKA